MLYFLLPTGEEEAHGRKGRVLMRGGLKVEVVSWEKERGEGRVNYIGVRTIWYFG